MDKVLQFIKTRSIAYFIALAAVICGVVAFIVYLAAGTNNFVTSLSPSVIVPMAIGIVVGVAMLVRISWACSRLTWRSSTAWSACSS